jgi:hypothetical protein
LFVQTLLAAALGLAVYLLAAWAIRIEELQEVIAAVRARFRRRPIEAT